MNARYNEDAPTSTFMMRYFWVYSYLAYLFGIQCTVEGGTAKGPSVNPFNSPLSTHGTLWCYECQENYANQGQRRNANGALVTGFDALNGPCLTNMSGVTLRQCGPGTRYCKYERTDLYTWTVQSVERSCATYCSYGCRFNGYGITTRRCTTCCTSDGCNSMFSRAVAMDTPPWTLQVFLLLMGTTLLRCVA